MAIIIPPTIPESFENKELQEYLIKSIINSKTKEKSSKIIIYFRKEIDITDQESLNKFMQLLAKTYDLNLFDDIYITKGKDIEELEFFKEGYTAAAINEVKHLKKDIYQLKNVVSNLLKIIKILKDTIKKEEENLHKINR